MQLTNIQHCLSTDVYLHKRMHVTKYATWQFFKKLYSISDKSINQVLELFYLPSEDLYSNFILSIKSTILDNLNHATRT